MTISYITENNLKGISSEYIVSNKQVITEDLLCFICKNLVFSPVSCNICKKLFCNNCINCVGQNALKQKNNSNHYYNTHNNTNYYNILNNTHNNHIKIVDTSNNYEDNNQNYINDFCPNKEIHHHKLELKDISLHINIKLRKLNLKCIYFHRGCHNEITYENYADHINTCEYKLCKCNICEYITINKFIDKHQCKDYTKEKVKKNTSGNKAHINDVNPINVIANNSINDYNYICFCGITISSINKSDKNKFLNEHREHLKECEIMNKLCNDCTLVIKTHKSHKSSNNDDNNLNFANNISNFNDFNKNNISNSIYNNQIKQYKHNKHNKHNNKFIDFSILTPNYTFEVNNTNEDLCSESCKKDFEDKKYPVYKGNKKIKEIISKYSNKDNSDSELGFFLTGKEDTFKKSFSQTNNNFNCFTKSYIKLDVDYESKLVYIEYNYYKFFFFLISIYRVSKR